MNIHPTTPGHKWQRDQLRCQKPWWGIVHRNRSYVPPYPFGWGHEARLFAHTVRRPLVVQRRIIYKQWLLFHSAVTEHGGKNSDSGIRVYWICIICGSYSDHSRMLSSLLSTKIFQPAKKIGLIREAFASRKWYRLGIERRERGDFYFRKAREITTERTVEKKSETISSWMWDVGY